MSCPAICQRPLAATILALFLLACSGALQGVCAPVDLLAENFNRHAIGRLEAGAEFGPGRDGEALLLTGNATVVYDGVEFPRAKGRIEMDLCVREPMVPVPDKKHFMLLTDVGAAGAWRGATVVYWDNETGDLSYGVFDGGWQWLSASDFEWTVDEWHHLGFSFGPEGRTLEIDGNVVARNDYGAGIMPRTMRLGTMDGYSVSAPVSIDNFVVSYEAVDELRVSRRVVCPRKDGLLDEVTVHWSLAGAAQASLDVIGDAGDVRQTLVAPGSQDAGAHESSFSGDGLPTGDYTIRLTVSRAGQPEKTFEAPVSVDEELSWKPAGPMMRDQFPLGVWYFWEDDASYIGRHVDDEDQARRYYESTVADLASLGVNTIIGNWTPKDHREYLLDAAQKHGLRVIVHLDEVNSYLWNPDRLATDNFVADIRDAIDTAKDHPATLGYYLVDEPAPTAENIANIKMARQVVEAIDPAHPGFSCLNTGWEIIYPQVEYQVLLVDIYPVYSARLQGDVLNGYIGALDRARRAAGEGPLWVIPQAFGFKNRPGSIPEPNELSLMVWEAVAHGAKGIIYFIYQSTTQIQGEWLRGIVDMDLKPMDHRHAEVRRIDDGLQAIAETLLSLRWRENDLATADPGIDVQVLEGDDGAEYLCVVNQSTKDSAEADLLFSDVRARGLRGLMDVGSKETLTVGAPIALEPGEGRLLKLVRE